MTPEELVARGFYIFPVHGKQPLVKWRSASTQDLPTIALWQRQFSGNGHPPLGWGIDCGKSNKAVIDVDCGKIPTAEETLFQLMLEYGPLPPTLKSRTISTGYHLIHEGQIKNSASNKLGIGLDTRGMGGFIVAPGSPGYTIELDLPITPIPDWVVNLVGAPTERTKPEPDPNYEYDTPMAISLAVQFLETAEPAVMTQGGNTQIYRIAAHVKDFGVSCDKAVELMLTHWYDRCVPNNRMESLGKIVCHAYDYGYHPPGIRNPEAVFEPWEDPEPQKDIATQKSLFIDLVELLTGSLKINYLIEGIIETPSTGLMFGESTAGKSFLGLGLGMSVAYGIPWLGHEVAKRGLVFYLCGEGQKGIPRRLKAWLKHHGLDPKADVLKVSRRRLELDANSAETMRAEIESMVSKWGRPALIIVDTLARHLPGSADENSAKDVGAFINAVDYLKDAFRCVLLIIHHSGKKALDVSRGSSVLKAAMDFEIKVSTGVVAYTKQKDGELPEPFGFDLLDVEVEFGVKSAVIVESALDPSVRTLKLTVPERMAFDCLKMLVSSKGQNEVTLETWKMDFRVNSLAANDKAKDKAFSRAVTKLRQAKAVLVEGDVARLNGVVNDD